MSNSSLASKADLNDWLSYIESFSPGYKCNSLSKLKKVAEKLGLLKFKAHVITVAGTNGKGSTVRFLEEILLAAGLKVASFNSPHILSYNERIRVDGQSISDQKLLSVFPVIEKACQDLAVNISFFEFTTLTALKIFQDSKLDVIILEVGLGGRFDATNIVDSDISVISSIGLDHTHILGKTRTLIGEEKAGIMRSLHPVVCGRNMPNSVVRRAKKLKAPLYRLGKEFTFKATKRNWLWQSLDKKLENLPLTNLDLKNAALALMVIEFLKRDFELSVSLTAIKKGLKKAFLWGRGQVIASKPELILDVAHNPDAVKLLSDRLKLLPKKRTLAVFSMLKDKDVTKSLKSLAKQVEAWYVAPIKSHRATLLSDLVKKMKRAKIKNINEFAGLSEAFKGALMNAQPDDRIIVFGSFYVIAEVLKSLTGEF